MALGRIAQKVSSPMPKVLQLRWDALSVQLPDREDEVDEGGTKYQEEESKYDQEPEKVLAEEDLDQASDVAAQQANLEMEPGKEVPFSVEGMASLNRADTMQKLGEAVPPATASIELESPLTPVKPQQPKTPQGSPAKPSPRGRTPRGAK